MALEPTEIRLVRKHMTDYCVREATTEGPAKARMLTFVDAVCNTAMELAGANYLQPGSHNAVEPLDKDLVETYAELEAAVNEIVPKILGFRQSWRPKADVVLEENHKRMTDSIKYISKVETLDVELPTPRLTDDEVEKAKINQEEIGRLETEIEPKLSVFIDKAEMNLTALQSLNVPEPQPDAENHADATPEDASIPSLRAAKVLSQALQDQAESKRMKLRSA